jgi:hypothetical protein
MRPPHVSPGAVTAAPDVARDVFAGFELVEADRHGRGDTGPEGRVKVATFRLAGRDFSCADSTIGSRACASTRLDPAVAAAQSIAGGLELVGGGNAPDSARAARTAWSETLRFLADALG